MRVQTGSRFGTRRLHQFSTALGAVLLATVGAVHALPCQAQSSGIVIEPINSTPQGQTYGRWAAAWFQWVYQIPAAENPLNDTTGKNCDQRQVDEVWFLAGVFGSGEAERTCTIPAGKSLFFPLINNGYGAFLNDPANTRTEEYVRQQAACSLPVNISVQIDQFKVPRPDRFFTGPSGSQSPLFNIQLPPDNFFGLTVSDAPELALSPSAEQGYYLLLRPLTAGSHRIHWTATGCANAQDITYHLMVQ